MGVVYRATQETLNREVAVKVVRAGAWASPSHVARFLREQHVLARLRHPNIAQVFDAGVTDGGPYFAMERIHGEPLDAWCDQHALGLKERLHLFCDVCSAVHSAHQSLVVHCDLKPSNVLVEDREAGPNVKLLDFGLARLLDEAGARTATNERALTPEYAAPEQFDGREITTATDVYALGVILYELASGQRPFQTAAHSETTPPSLASAATDEAATARSTSTPQLRRRLRGDLDRIVRRALHSAPERRYASVKELGDDVGRWLNGLPVDARPDALGYRAGLFVRRHARALAVAAAVVVVGFGGLVFYTLRLAEARDHSEQSRMRAEQTTDLVIRLFEQADPWSARDPDLTLRQALSEGLAVLATDSANTPRDVRATLLDVGGRLYAVLGLYDDAEPLLREAYAIRQALPGDNRADVALSLYSLAVLARGRGEGGEAAERFEDALRLQRAALSPTDPALLNTLRDLSELDGVDGKHIRAEELAHERLVLVRLTESAGGVEEAQSLRTLAYVIERQRNATVEADSLLDRAAAILRRTVGPRHPEMGAHVEVQAIIEESRGEYEEAVRLQELSRDIFRDVYAPDHPAHNRGLGRLVQLYVNAGRIEDAVAVSREMLAWQQTTRGDEHWSTGQAMHNLASALGASGSYDEALEVFRQSREIWTETNGPRSSSISHSLNMEAQMVWKQRGDFVQAERVFRRSLAIARDLALEDSTNEDGVQNVLRNLAAAVYAQGRYDEVAEIIHEVRERYRRTQGANTYGFATTTWNLAEIMEAAGHLSEAKAYAEEARRGMAQLDRQEEVVRADSMLARIARKEAE